MAKKRLEIRKDVILIVKEKCAELEMDYNPNLLASSLTKFIANRLNESTGPIYKRYKIEKKYPAAALLDRAFGEKPPGYVNHYANIYLPDLLCYYARDCSYKELVDKLDESDVRDSTNQSTLDQNEILSDLLEKIDAVSFLIDQGLMDEAAVEFEKAQQLCNSEYSWAKLICKSTRLLISTIGEYDEFMKYMNDVLNILNDFGRVEEIIEIKKTLATTAFVYKRYDQAKLLSEKLLLFAVEISDNYCAVLACNFLACIFHISDDNENAVDYWLKTLYYSDILLNAKVSEIINEEAIKFTAISNHNLSQIFKELNKISEAKKYALDAIVFFEKLNNQKEMIANIYLDLAIFEGLLNRLSYEDCINYISKAQNIFAELNNNKGLAACSELLSRVFYELKQESSSLEHIADAIHFLDNENDKEKIAKLMLNSAGILKGNLAFEAAESIIDTIINLFDNDLNKIVLINAYQEKIEVSTLLGKNELINGICEKAIGSLRNIISNETDAIEKAFLTGRIGEFLISQNKIEEALQTFEEVEKVYLSYNVKEKIYTLRIIIADLYRKLNDFEKAVSIWRMLEDLRINNPKATIAAKANLSMYYLDNNEIKKAELLLIEAKNMTIKYRLERKFLNQIQGLLDEIDYLRAISIPPKHSYSDIFIYFERLFKYNRSAFKPFLDYAYYKFASELQHHFYSMPGTKAMIFSDSLSHSHKSISKLAWLFDFFLIVPKLNYYKSSPQNVAFFVIDKNFLDESELSNEEKYDILTKANPKKKFEDKIDELFFIGPLIKSKSTKYIFLPLNKMLTKKELKQDGYSNDAFIGLCYDGQLNDSVYEQFRNFDREEFLARNYFAINYPFPKNAVDIVYSRLHYCYKLGYIPIFFDSEIHTKRVERILQLEVKFPTDVIGNSAINDIKQMLYFSSSLPFNLLIEQLKTLKVTLEKHQGTNSVPGAIALVQFENFATKIYIPVILLREDN